MGKLNSEQRNILREFLEAQGLSFKPLQDEMMDHISCDVEDRARFHQPQRPDTGAPRGERGLLINSD
jgi:hypothetical protein